MRRFILLCALLIPTQAGAVLNTWIEHGGSDSAGTATAVSSRAGEVYESGTAVYLFDDSGTDVGFSVNTGRASCNLVQDQLASGGTAAGSIRSCPNVKAGGTKDTTTCPEAICTFSTDDSCNITRGEYLWDITTAATSGDEAVFSCRGYK